MARGMHRLEADGTQDDFVTILHHAVGVRRGPIRTAEAGADDLDGAFKAGFEFIGAANEIGVDVGLQDVCDPQPFTLGDFQEIVDVASGGPRRTAWSSSRRLHSCRSLSRE